MRPGEEKGWWSRNWAWFLPLTCLGCLGIPAACVGGCVWLGVSTVKDSMHTPIAEAVEAAALEPAIVEALGEPIEMSWVGITGNMDTDWEGSRSDFSLPIQGPRGKAMLHIEASRTGEEWIYDRLEAELDGRDETIDLRGRIEELRRAPS